MKRGQGSTKKGQSGRIPTSKPFCDCRHCECRNCPDVLQKLAITIKDSKSGGIRGKGAKRKKCSKSLKRVSQTSEQRPSILDMLNPNRNCDCEIMARAIRSHIHMNMGMTDQRRGNSEQRPSNSKDIE